MFSMDHRCFKNVGGDSRDEWGNALCNKIINWNLENNFGVQIKIVFHDVENSKIWGQTLMMHSSINVYPIDKLLKTLAYCDSNNVWYCLYYCDHGVSV